MNNELVTERREDGVLILTLNRPDRLNAWAYDLGDRYFDLLDQADASPNVRAIVVNGAGRGFCSGMDAEVLAQSSAGIRRMPAKARRDEVTICAGQEPRQALAAELQAHGIESDLIGGARFAAELDAIRAIDEGPRLALTF